MGMALKIRTILLERNMSIKELSEKLGYKGANLYNKLRRDNLTEKELQRKTGNGKTQHYLRQELCHRVGRGRKGRERID